MGRVKDILNWIRPNPFDSLLKRAVKESKSRFLIVWNRGLGDIPLGLYALVYRIRSFVPNAQITFLTRKDLADAFKMIDDVNTIVGLTWERGKPINITETLSEHHLLPSMFDLILEKPDPTKWVPWQIGTLTPKMNWKKEWDTLGISFGLQEQETYIGAHVQTETEAYYGYEKNWPLSYWQELFFRISENKKGKIILFGSRQDLSFPIEDVIDLRGKTSLFEMLAIIKNSCKYLVAPDSGVLSTAYYLNENFPLKLVSLWADPRQGILRQKVASPNKKLEHIPIIGKKDKIGNIPVDEVYHALFN